jgi:glycosyltransferase involved in cell wall biosynthesis
MKILLLTTDLYKTIGGGQTVYKKIIEATPKVEFFYYLDTEDSDARRPKNAHPVFLAARRNLKVLSQSSYARFRLHALEEADRMARSVAEQSFDIAEIPDFLNFGSALRDAFAHHHVEIGRLVLAMHGNCSKSTELNWGAADHNTTQQRMLEQEQFETADRAYAISRCYMREWQSIAHRDIHWIDPAHFVEADFKTSHAVLFDEKPSLFCIGRSERLKGNDLFVELVRWLQPGSFHRAAHIGDHDNSFRGISSKQLLENIAKHREIHIESLPAMNRKKLALLYANRTIVVLPVRYDTLNLVALEALFSGCPVAISSRAGVCDYLDKTHPSLPYLKIDLDNLYSAVADLQHLIDHYDRHREALLDSLKKHLIVPQQPLDMDLFYQTALTAPILHTNKSITRYKERNRSTTEQLAHLARLLLPLDAYQTARRMATAPKSILFETIKESGCFGNARFFSALSDSRSLPSRLMKIGKHSEFSPRKKLEILYSYARNPLYRCNFWLDIARMERILGNELIAVAYELRILRLLGEDRFALLSNVILTLNKYGFSQEAKAAQAMYAEPEKAEEKVYAYLKDAYKRNFRRQDKALQLSVDFRNGQPAKAAVIVSLYKAADKLKVFLTALSEQTLIKKGEVEIILIDSGSPTNEYCIIEDFLQNKPLNAVYARSAERETIQAAWNRGIGLAKAPYLTFLGVDETLYPEALETLVAELDGAPEVDWVMSSSLATSVGETGLHEYDIMQYNRTGATKDHTYLDTCYTSWVGGMYRKTMHDRFGYYDETFGAAGDTEIKNRILPFINVKFISKMLGLFLNYPDGQTTASAKAEIEDLRAWYIHRTPGGLRYAFENRPIEELEKQLCNALGYRKSYLEHTSTDIEYAYYLAQYIEARNPNSGVAVPVLPGLKKLLEKFRSLEFAYKIPSRLESMLILGSAWRMASRYQSLHRESLQLKAIPCYKVFNDNRYEQHSWLWKTN